MAGQDVSSSSRSPVISVCSPDAPRVSETSPRSPLSYVLVRSLLWLPLFLCFSLFLPEAPFRCNAFVPHPMHALVGALPALSTSNLAWSTAAPSFPASSRLDGDAGVSDLGRATIFEDGGLEPDYPVASYFL